MSCLRRLWYRLNLARVPAEFDYGIDSGLCAHELLAFLTEGCKAIAERCAARYLANILYKHVHEFWHNCVEA